MILQSQQVVLWTRSDEREGEQRVVVEKGGRGFRMVFKFVLSQQSNLGFLGSSMWCKLWQLLTGRISVSWYISMPRANRKVTPAVSNERLAPGLTSSSCWGSWVRNLGGFLKSDKRYYWQVSWREWIYDWTSCNLIWFTQNTKTCKPQLKYLWSQVLSLIGILLYLHTTSSP